MNQISVAAPIRFLDLLTQRQRLEPSLSERLSAVLAHGQFVLGPEVAELETQLAAFCGARHCVGVSSGTDALQIALMAENIGPGDAVFLPAFTYTATAEVPLLLRATPVFVDIDPYTFQIDPAALSARISQVRRGGKLTPRAMIGVDLFGQPADWPALQAIGRAERLFMLDDCAQSFGAALNGQRLGSFADAAATSFFPSKPLGSYGDGGALFTDSDERADLYRSLRSHGEGATRYEVLRTGMNGRLDTLQAAVLLAKLPAFAWELERRVEIARHYDSRLAGHVTTPRRVANSCSAWSIYSILLPDGSVRDTLREYLNTASIPTAIYYPRPLHQQPAYSAQHDGSALPISEQIADRILALPIHPDLEARQVDVVCDAVIAGLAGSNRAQGLQS